MQTDFPKQQSDSRPKGEEELQVFWVLLQCLWLSLQKGSFYLVIVT